MLYYGGCPALLPFPILCLQLHSSVGQTPPAPRPGQIPGSAHRVTPAALAGGGERYPAVPQVPPNPQHPRGDHRDAAPLLRARSPPQPASSPAAAPPAREAMPRSSRSPPSPLPARRVQCPGRCSPGGSPPQHPCDGDSKSARRSPTSALSIGSGPPHPAHWRCRRRPPLHKAPFDRASPVGSRGAAEPEPGGAAGGEAGAAGCAPAAAGGAGSPPGP